MTHSLVSLQKRPWIFIIELFKYLLFRTGMLLAPVVQIVVFASSLLLNEKGLPESADIPSNTLPDIEIMPVFVTLISAVTLHNTFLDGI